MYEREENLQIICGMAQGTEPMQFMQEVEKLAGEKGYGLFIHYCFSKVEIEHAVYRSQKAIVLVQEMLETASPYRANELSDLRDMKDVKIIVSISREYYGSGYMAAIYAAGILDAVYESEATPTVITGLILEGRNRAQARKYYGLQSMGQITASLDILEDEILHRYVGYLNAAATREDTKERYLTIIQKLTMAQNSYLISRMPPELKEELREIDEFVKYQALIQIEKKKKRFSLKSI